MSLFRLKEISGRTPDGIIEIFDYQTANVTHDIVFAKLNGKHDGGTNRRSTFTYAIKSGTATVSINGNDVIAHAGDVVTVQPGLHEVLQGQAELFVMCSPPFDLADEITDQPRSPA